MRTESLEILQNLSTKILHDFAGTIFGIKQSVEFLDHKDSKIRSQAMALINLSLQKFNKKFEYLRHMYAYDGESSNILLRDFLQSLHFPQENSKIEMSFSAPKDCISITPKFRKLAFNILAMAFATIPVKGIINLEVLHHTDEQVQLLVNIHSQTNINEKLVEPLLVDYINEVSITPMNVQTFYTLLLAKDMNMEIKSIRNKNDLTIKTLIL